MNHWVNMFALAKALGFAYFNAYVTPDGWVLGWVTRTGTNPYMIYYFDSRILAGLAQTTRGSARNAMDTVDGAVKRLNVTVGLVQSWLPELTVQIVKATALKKLRGW